MANHREIFNQLLMASKYSAKEISARTGINESRLSRFRTGKLDLEAGEFFDLLACFPVEFQELFWAKFHCADNSWRSLVMSAAPQDIEEILILLAERWSILEKTQKNRESTDRRKLPLAI